MYLGMELMRGEKTLLLNKRQQIIKKKWNSRVENKHYTRKDWESKNKYE